MCSLSEVPARSPRQLVSSAPERMEGSRKRRGHLFASRGRCTTTLPIDVGNLDGDTPQTNLRIWAELWHCDRGSRTQKQDSGNCGAGDGCTKTGDQFLAVVGGVHDAFHFFGRAPAWAALTGMNKLPITLPTQRRGTSDSIPKSSEPACPRRVRLIVDLVTPHFFPASARPRLLSRLIYLSPFHHLHKTVAGHRS